MRTRDLELVSGSHRRQGQGPSGRFRRRQRRWRGNGPERLGEGHPPQPRHLAAATFFVAEARAQQESRRGGNTNVPCGSACPAVSRSNSIGRSLIEGGNRRALPPACWGRQLMRAAAQGFRGNPEAACQACAGAQRTPNAFRVVSAGTVVATPPSPIPCG